MMLKIWFGKAGAMSLFDKQTSYRKIKALCGNCLDDQIVIFRSLRAEGGPKNLPRMKEFNELTKFINRFTDILNAVNFHSIHSKIIGSNDIFLRIIKE